MKLTDIKPTNQQLLENFDAYVLGDDAKLTMEQIEFLADNDDLTLEQYVMFHHRWRDEIHAIGARRNAECIAKYGRTLIEQANYEAEQEYLAEQAGKKGAE